MMGAPANGTRFMRNTPNSATPRSTSMSAMRSCAATGAASECKQVPGPVLVGRVVVEPRLQRRRLPPQVLRHLQRLALILLRLGVLALHRERRGADLERRRIVVELAHHVGEHVERALRIAARLVGTRREQRREIELAVAITGLHGPLEP